MEYNLSEALKVIGLTDKPDSSSTGGIVIAKNPTISYTARYRNQWARPDYDLNQIRKAQDSDSFISRAIEKKAIKFLLSGYEFTGENPKTIEYIKKRVAQIETASGKSFDMFLLNAAEDLFSINNHMWILYRDEENSGGRPYKYKGKMWKPISAIFVPAFESLEFKTKENGELEKVKQIIPGSSKRPEWKADDLIHFYSNRRPGNLIGVPSLYPAIEDVLILRRLEEQVGELIESNLFPLFHYKIGTDEHPERVNPKTGLREVEQIAQTLQYMPSSGVYISDWRHSIEAIGSEGKALNIEKYLEYFRARVFTALGVSSVDFGMGDTSNRSTAQTQTKSFSEQVEAMQILMKGFLQMHLITPLLLEGAFPFDPLKPENTVEISFGKIDMTEQSNMENVANQLYQSNAITHEELRNKIGKRPLKPEQEASLNYHKFPDRVAVAKAAEIKAGDAKSPNAANQHGTSAKKTSAKKDSEIYVDDLRDIYYSINLDSIDISKEVLSNRILHIFLSRKVDSLSMDHDFDFIFDLKNKIDVYLDNFFKYLINKHTEMNNIIDFYTVLEICYWRLDRLVNNLDNISDKNLDTLFKD